MQKDIRSTALYREAEALYRSLRQPGTGQITDAAEAHASPDGQHAVFTGTFVDTQEGTPATRICQIDLRSGDIRVLTFGAGVDRMPKYSPDGRHVAFLSDRHKAGDFQLYLLNLSNGAARSTERVEGWVEYLHWSPDGRRILLGVAGHGAELAGGQVPDRPIAETLPSWMPMVETGREAYRWRRAWVYGLSDDRVRPVSPIEINVWEAVWCGNETLASVASPGPAEGLWYRASLYLIEIGAVSWREIYAPQNQIGLPAASPSGLHLAIIDAICSDRWFVAGDLRLIETTSGKVRSVDTRGVDITYIEWRSDQQLLLAGHRGFDTVVGLCDAISGAFTEVWSSRELGTGGRYATVSGFRDSGDCVFVAESFLRAPEIAVIRLGKYSSVKSFNVGHVDCNASPPPECVCWKASDGLEIQGWLLRPSGTGPHPLIMNVHGGPVWHWRPVWLGRRSAHLFMLIKRGYAIFLPNPRGSSGRGREFSARVVGDMGGADTYDCLSGLDHLVEQGIADPKRLGVTGISYGGFLSSWVITQDSRFAAAVPVAPVTNHVSAHLVSNIPDFVTLFLADSYTNPDGKYFQRSPIMHAHKVRTPTLNICGALDRCTPPEEALQFHNALLENGVTSVLLTYPEEGHGVRMWPAAIDYAARVVAWFEEHMPGKIAPVPAEAARRLSN